MAFNGTEGSAILLSKAADLTKEYRMRNPGTRIGHFFGKDILNDIMEQEGCMGIRIYYGQDPETGEREVVIVGADAGEDDMLELVADFSRSCPTHCSSSNSLNS